MVTAPIIVDNIKRASFLAAAGDEPSSWLAMMSTIFRKPAVAPSRTASPLRATSLPNA
jgi:hypothetical protein